MQTARQAEIVSTALEIVSEKGITSLTIKAISSRIGISEAAIYRHYESKTHIMLAILDLFKKQSTQLFQQRKNEQKPAPIKIKEIFSRHFVKFHQTPSLIPVIFSEELFRNEPQLLNKVGDIIRENQYTLCQIIRQGQDRQEIRNDLEAEQIATIVLGTLRLFIKKWQLSKYTFNLVKEGEKMVRSVITVISPNQEMEKNHNRIV